MAHGQAIDGEDQTRAGRIVEKIGKGMVGIGIVGMSVAYGTYLHEDQSKEAQRVIYLERRIEKEQFLGFSPEEKENYRAEVSKIRGLD